MNQPVHEVLHTAAQPLRKIARHVLHLRDAALEFRQIALHGARLHLTRRGRGEDPLRGFGHSTAATTSSTSAATLALALVCRQHLSSQKPFSFYLRSAQDDSFVSPLSFIFYLNISFTFLSFHFKFIIICNLFTIII